MSRSHRASSGFEATVQNVRSIRGESVVADMVLWSSVIIDVVGCVMVAFGNAGTDVHRSDGKLNRSVRHSVHLLVEIDLVLWIQQMVHSMYSTVSVKHPTSDVPLEMVRLLVSVRSASEHDSSVVECRVNSARNGRPRSRWHRLSG
jgi:hypothetical protein